MPGLTCSGVSHPPEVYYVFKAAWSGVLFHLSHRDLPQITDVSFINEQYIMHFNSEKQGSSCSPYHSVRAVINSASFSNSLGKLWETAGKL